MAVVVFGCDVVVTLAIYFTFLVKFRETSDIFGLSLEMKRVGAFYLVALSELAHPARVWGSRKPIRIARNGTPLPPHVNALHCDIFNRES